MRSHLLFAKPMNLWVAYENHDTGVRFRMLGHHFDELLDAFDGMSVQGLRLTSEDVFSIEVGCELPDDDEEE